MAIQFSDGNVMIPLSSPPSDVSRAVVRRYGPIVVIQQSDKPRPTGSFIPGEVYSGAVASLPIFCIDALPVNRERETIYLAERCVYPMKGLWVLGGRGNLNELPPDVIRRKLCEEVGINIAEDRLRWFSFVPVYHWDNTKQHPDGPGGNNVCGMCYFEPTPEELAAMQSGLKPSEYNVDAGLREYGRDDIKALYDAGQLHPMIYMAYHEIFGF